MERLEWLIIIPTNITGRKREGRGVGAPERGSRVGNLLCRARREMGQDRVARRTVGEGIASRGVRM